MADAGAAGDIHRHRFRPAAHGLDLVHDVQRLVMALAIRQQDIGAGFRQAQRDDRARPRLPPVTTAFLPVREKRPIGNLSVISSALGRAARQRR